MDGRYRLENTHKEIYHGPDNMVMKVRLKDPRILQCVLKDCLLDGCEDKPNVTRVCGLR